MTCAKLITTCFCGTVAKNAEAVIYFDLDLMADILGLFIRGVAKRWCALPADICFRRAVPR